MTTRVAFRLLGLAAALGLGCAPIGEYVWVDAGIPTQQRGDAAFVIAPGDVLGIRIAGQDALSSRALVRTDGKISLPLVNDQLAAGLTPATLALLLDAQFKTFVNNPGVTVLVEERHPDLIAVVGRVTTPGTFQIRSGTGVLQAIALAGGITPFAQRDRIFVLRRESDGRPPLRIRFRYQALLAAEPRSAGFYLRDADVLVVE
jgi:polysaccharide export outer membrane protein